MQPSTPLPPNKGLAFLDLAEEVKNAAVVAPIAIIIAVVSTGFIGFWINVALCVSDCPDDLSSMEGTLANGRFRNLIVWDQGYECSPGSNDVGLLSGQSPPLEYSRLQMSVLDSD